MPVRERNEQRQEEKKQLSPNPAIIARDIDQLTDYQNSTLFPGLRLEEMINWIIAGVVFISAIILFSRNEPEVKPETMAVNLAQRSSDIWWGKVSVMIVVLLCAYKVLSNRRAIANSEQENIELKKNFEEKYGRNPLWHHSSSSSLGSQSSSSADSKITTSQSSNTNKGPTGPELTVTVEQKIVNSNIDTIRVRGDEPVTMETVHKYPETVEPYMKIKQQEAKNRERLSRGVTTIVTAKQIEGSTVSSVSFEIMSSFSSQASSSASTHTTTVSSLTGQGSSSTFPSSRGKSTAASSSSSSTSSVSSKMCFPK